MLKVLIDNILKIVCIVTAIFIVSLILGISFNSRVLLLIAYITECSSPVLLLVLILYNGFVTGDL